MRSASGSLAMTRSAPRLLASAIAASSVRGYSGLATWSGTLGKSPSGVRCEARMWTRPKPAVSSALATEVSPTPCSGV